MIAISKSVSNIVLDDVANRYNNTCHRIIKMTHFNVKSGVYIKYNVDSNAKFKIGDQVKLSKYENVFSKAYTPNWSEEVFVIRFLLKIL